jgi:drug/metabolite transporter (DMT)-like permease
MAFDDLDPVSKLKLGKAFQWVALAAVAIGVIGGILVALSPTEGTDMTTRQNILFGIFCCFAPTLLPAIPLMIVGRMMRKAAQPDEAGSLYRGWD